MRTATWSSSKPAHSEPTHMTPHLTALALLLALPCLAAEPRAIRDLEYANEAGVEALKHVSFNVYGGEILGVDRLVVKFDDERLVAAFLRRLGQQRREALLAVAVAKADRSPAVTAITLKTANIGGVTVLTNAKGLTLYWFAPDTAIHWGPGWLQATSVADMHPPDRAARQADQRVPPVRAAEHAEQRVAAALQAGRAAGRSPTATRLRAAGDPGSPQPVRRGGRHEAPQPLRRVRAESRSPVWDRGPPGWASLPMRRPTVRPPEPDRR